jgi:imidazoleglycerol phosphate dehydratase HisB
MSAKMNLHIKLMQGRNNHHIAESLFKGFGRALAQAVAVDPRAGHCSVDQRIPLTCRVCRGVSGLRDG